MFKSRYIDEPPALSFLSISQWDWDLILKRAGKWDIEKIWAGKWELDYPPPSGPSDFLQHQNYKEDPEYFISNCSFPQKESAPYAYTNTPIMRVYTWFVLYLYITFLKVSMRTSVIFTWKQLIETQFFEFSVKC